MGIKDRNLGLKVIMYINFFYKTSNALVIKIPELSACSGPTEMSSLMLWSWYTSESAVALVIRNFLFRVICSAPWYINSIIGWMLRLNVAPTYWLCSPVKASGPLLPETHPSTWWEARWYEPGPSAHLTSLTGCCNKESNQFDDALFIGMH